ncbi:hypothetical protein CYLTODRAFT_361648 [Cylindrobasidium torrendii FP15055 ss-10]|uniref:Dynamin-type G domain-containing protein n=1 Tax=Cylindrobasidium torrendii FP15055 ss-10 TaxID=1314674 RepID=A0A0D7AWW6_9AGAR|nr:hypothetical protein CYLTODRAFT_361648 [Cylindrobasidium torrendii FP15055 ss-10]
MSLGSSNYASRTKDLLGLVNQLRAVGAQSDVDLPRIVVIGNQSAGKSSVVEAISGITVPRDAGTCTRVPMEIRVSSSETPWQCRISIRREYGKSQRLDTIQETPFGETITDKSRVEEMLKRAQVAVLNPVIPHSKVLSASLQEVVDWGDQSVKTTPFSRNIVCVDLEGPDLTDLSFIDLPGIVANADNEIVQLVEDIVTDHIRGNCIILVALPMTDDVENQKALKLARTYDAQGNRTIGVLTKPDMLTGGATKSLSLWLDVIEGRRYPLSHGYFCTKQPDDRDRSENVTSAQARTKEKEFFRSTSPWRTSIRPDHFGTEHLVRKLSTLLVSVIDETLPKIRQDASDALAACRKDLSRIPDQLDEDPATHMLKLITDFAGEISSIVKGRSDASDLIQQNRAAYRQYKIAIRATAPNFIPSLKGEHQAASILTLDGEDDDLSLVQTPGEKFDLSDMKRHISKSITRELPGNVPFDAKTALIFKFQDTWKASMLECFEKVQNHTVKILYDYVDNEFSRFFLLNGHMKTFLNELCTKHAADCLKLLEQILETEMSPFTQNTHYLEDCTDKWLAKYKDARAGKKSLNNGPPAKKLKEDNNGNSNPFVFFGANGNNHGGTGGFPFRRLDCAHA